MTNKNNLDFQAEDNQTKSIIKQVQTYAIQTVIKFSVWIVMFLLLFIIVYPIYSLIFSKKSDKTIVYDSVNPQYSKFINMGQALDTWENCDDRDWDSFKTEKGEKIVEFTCELEGVDKLSDKLKANLSKNLKGDELDKMKDKMDIDSITLELHAKYEGGRDAMIGKARKIEQDS